MQDRHEIVREVCHRIGHVVRQMLDQVDPAQFAQPLGQDLGGDRWQALAQFPEPEITQLEVIQDQRVPAVAEKREPGLDRALLGA